jgi:hypothetical protein
LSIDRFIRRQDGNIPCTEHRNNPPKASERAPTWSSARGTTRGSFDGDQIGADSVPDYSMKLGLERVYTHQKPTLTTSEVAEKWQEANSSSESESAAGRNRRF